MDLTWFRKPGPQQPGTLNLCYNALDRQVIRGRARDPAVRTVGGTLDFATLLERVAALAGALRVLGVEPGSGVRTRLADPVDALLAALACERLGAVHGEVEAPAVLVTSHDEDERSARVRVLRGVPVVDDRRDVDWDLAVKAGRDEPAPCAEVTPGSAAWCTPGESIAVRDAIGHGSRLGGWHALLCAGLPLDLTGGSTP